MGPKPGLIKVVAVVIVVFLIFSGSLVIIGARPARGRHQLRRRFPPRCGRGTPLQDPGLPEG